MSAACGYAVGRAMALCVLGQTAGVSYGPRDTSPYYASKIKTGGFVCVPVHQRLKLKYKQGHASL